VPTQPPRTAATRPAAAPKPDRAGTRPDRAGTRPDQAGSSGTGPPRRPPAPPLPGRDPIWARLLIGLGVLLVLGSVGLIGAGKLLIHRYDHQVKKETLLGDGARVEPRSEPARLVGPLNYLLIGSDARAWAPENGQRSDTIIILHIPASLDRAYLLSIPRDLRVEIPPFPVNGFRGSHEKINAAFEYGGGGSGGIQLLSMTLANLLDIRFDGAAVIDFNGFQDVVKTLGGVDMCVDQRVTSIHLDQNGKGLHNRGSTGQPAVYEPGCREFNSWQALDYVRQRYSLPDGDYGRMRHQQEFLRACLIRAREKGIATNPVKIDEVLRAVTGSLTVDTGGVPLESLVFGLRDIRPSNLLGLTVPSEPQWIGNTSYIVAFDEAKLLYRALAADSLDAWALENPTWVNHL
jgi:LCP family protein required for cell wall assembly